MESLLINKVLDRLLNAVSVTFADRYLENKKI